MERTVYDIDSNAAAVILYEEGILDFEYGSYSYNYEVVAKILSNEDISDFTEIIIPKRVNTQVNSISAETYNLTSNGIERNRLDKDHILKEKIEDNLKVIKFSIPNVRKGTIVHYAYTVRKTDPVTIPEFTFQHKYPSLYARYSVSAPATLSLNKIIRSSKKFEEVQKERDLDNCQACEYNDIKDSKRFIGWATRNIPALKQEPYAGNPDNFRERIKVLITGYYNSSGFKVDVFNTWNNFSKKYLYDNDNYIGQVFKENAFLDAITDEVTRGAAGDQEKARALLTYVKSHYTQVERDDYDLKTVYKTRQGNAEAINLLFIAMMKKAGLDCDPVVLSTRLEERLSDLYPSPFGLDYLVAIFKNDGKSYFLDASSPGLPFGALPKECYNGYARVVNKEGYAVNLSPDDIKEKQITVVSLSPAEGNRLAVKADLKYGIFRSERIRNQAKGDSAEALKIMSHSLSETGIDVTPGSLSVTNLSNPEQPLKLHYEGSVPFNNNADIQYFDPYFVRQYNTNPFPVADRQMPVEMDYNEEYTYHVSFKLPDGFYVEDYPQPLSLKFSEEGIMTFTNSFDYNKETATLNLNSRFQTYTTIFPATSYKDIRSFYEQMIQEQHKKITVKKN